MTVKEQVLELAASLPDDASFEQVMYEFYVREKIARGLADVRAGRLTPHEDIKARYLGR